jgi:hypothetical protein
MDDGSESLRLGRSIEDLKMVTGGGEADWYLPKLNHDGTEGQYTLRR